MNEPQTVTPDNARLLRLASYASVLTALVLILIKLAAWLVTGSVSLLASLVDSLMDSLASLINLLALRYSLQPPDAEHRFGHGKAEPLAGLAQACFICGSATFLCLHALERLQHPVVLEETALGIWVMVVAMVFTLVLLSFQHFVIARTGSTAIRADALHYASDLLTNISIIVALLLASLGWTRADPVIALLVAGYIFYSAGRIALDSVQQLLDRELPESVQEQILAIVMSHPQARGVHDLRTRQSGQVQFVQLHLELDKDLSLESAHAVADTVTGDIREVLPGAEVIVHEDPVDLSEPELRQ